MQFIISFLNGGQRRDLESFPSHLVRLLSALTAVWSVYQSIWATIDVVSLTIVFLALALALSFLLYTASPKADLVRIPFYDYALAALALAGGVYFTMKVDEMAERIPLFQPLSTGDIVMSTMMLLMLMEAVRRTLGFTMCVITIVLFAYNVWGASIPGFLHHSGVSPLHYLDIAFFTTDGVFGEPLRVAATYGFLFVIFGTLLHRCGGGDFFYRLSSAFAKRPGGSAKIAVVSSGLFGSVSGNPVADVVTTGSITIPIMKRSGFTANQAAAIEATACTGGTLLPPVMGAAAFIMAEMTGIPYRSIAAAALLPVFLYYVSLYLQVHLYAVRNGISGTGEVNEKIWTVLKQDSLFFIPIIVLVIVLSEGYSPSMVAVVSTVTLIIIAAVRSSTRMNPQVIYEQLAEATERILPVAMACAAAGLVMGGITMTGLANKFSEIITFASGGYVWISLVVAAALTILLGMGLPTSASYVLGAVLIGNTLVSLGLSMMQAHMFILYFAALSAITPPIAIASFAAAAIAKADPMEASWASMRKGIVVFLLPFAFAAHSGLLLEGTAVEIATAVFFAGLGVFCLSGAVEKYMLGHLMPWERVLLLVAGMMFFVLPVAWQFASFIPAAIGLSRNGLAYLRDAKGRQPEIEQLDG